LSAVVDSTFLQYTARAALFQTQNAIFSEIFLFFADFCAVDAKTAAFDAAKKGKSGEEAGKNRNGKVKRKKTRGSRVASVRGPEKKKGEKGGERGRKAEILRIVDVGRLLLPSR